MAASKKAILCIEDDEDTSEMLAFLLIRAGYEVAQAGTVAEGLAPAWQGGFEVTMLDWHLPDGTGIQLCKDIREFDSTTAILFYSGEARSQEVKEATLAGAHGFFIKPVDHDLLLETVAKYASAERVN